ncbi:hypothetical protein LCGC14_2302950, partial [marine sediment metagenome]
AALEHAFVELEVGDTIAQEPADAIVFFEDDDFVAGHAKHPRATHARYGRAICNYRLDNYAEAAKGITLVLKDPAFKKRDEALAVLANNHLLRKDYAGAKAAVDELIAKHPKSKRVELATLHRAQALYLLGQKAESAKACKAFLISYPKSPLRAEAQYFLALSQAALKQHTEAAATLEKLLKDFANSPYELDALLLLGQSRENLGALAEAAKQYRAMIAKAPPARQGEARYSLGVVLHNAGKYAEAIKELTAVGKADPKSQYLAPARLQLGMTQLAAGKPGLARRTLGQVAAKDASRAAMAKYGLARCDMAEKKYAPARAAVEALAAGDSDFRRRLAEESADVLLYLLMICEKAGACKLQEYAYQFGVRQSGYLSEPVTIDPVHEGAAVVYDKSKCILCGRCVEVCHNIQVSGAIDYYGRGLDTKIALPPGLSRRESDCVECGNCIDVCPTGALYCATATGAGRTWELEQVPTTCPYCGCGCTVIMNIRDNRIVKITSEPHLGINGGMLCVKGRFGCDFIDSSERLTDPLIRRDGKLVPVSWDEAMDFVAQKLCAIKQQFGPDAIGGLSSAKCTNEE